MANQEKETVIKRIGALCDEGIISPAEEEIAIGKLDSRRITRGSSIESNTEFQDWVLVLCGRIQEPTGIFIAQGHAAIGRKALKENRFQHWDGSDVKETTIGSPIDYYNLIAPKLKAKANGGYAIDELKVLRKKKKTNLNEHETLKAKFGWFLNQIITMLKLDAHVKTESGSRKPDTEYEDLMVICGPDSVQPRGRVIVDCDAKTQNLLNDNKPTTRGTDTSTGVGVIGQLINRASRIAKITNETHTRYGIGFAFNDMIIVKFIVSPNKLEYFGPLYLDADWKSVRLLPDSVQSKDDIPLFLQYLIGILVQCCPIKANADPEEDCSSVDGGGVIVVSMIGQVVRLIEPNGNQQVFKITELLGRGADSDAYCAVTEDGSLEVCLKIASSEISDQIKTEYAILKQLDGCFGVPKALFIGDIVDNAAYYGRRRYTGLVTDVVGVSLAGIRESGKEISLAEAELIWKSLRQTLDEIHAIGVVVADIKPHHFVLDKKTNRVFLVDYGAAFCYKSDTPSPYRTPMYAAFAGIHPWSRVIPKDDLESLIYSVASLVGELKWRKEPHALEKRKEISSQVQQNLFTNNFSLLVDLVVV